MIAMMIITVKVRGEEEEFIRVRLNSSPFLAGTIMGKSAAPIIPKLEIIAIVDETNEPNLAVFTIIIMERTGRAQS